MKYEDVDVALSFLPFKGAGGGIVLLVEKAADFPLLRRHIISVMGIPDANLPEGMKYNRRWIHFRKYYDLQAGNLEGIRDDIYPIGRACDLDPNMVMVEPFMYADAHCGYGPVSIDYFGLWCVQEGLASVSLSDFIR